MTAPSRLAFVLAVLLNGACAGAPFRAPTLSVQPELRALPSPPVAARGQSPPNGRTETITAPGARPSRGSLLAIGPAALDGASVGHELLRRLLVRHPVRLADVTGLGQLTASVAQTRDGDTATFNGPLMALLWGARLGAATHVLLTESLQVESSATTAGPMRLDASEMAQYGTERARAITECAADQARIDRELGRLEREFAEAEQAWRRGRPPVSLTPDDSFEQGQSSYRSAVESLRARRARCDGVEGRLPTLEALQSSAASEGTTGAAGAGRTLRATGRFRIVSLPGANLVWAATLQREGADPSQALAALFDALGEALPFGRRANDRDEEPPADAQELPTGPTNARPEAPHRHTHRRHGHEGAQ